MFIGQRIEMALNIRVRYMLEFKFITTPGTLPLKCTWYHFEFIIQVLGNINEMSIKAIRRNIAVDWVRSKFIWNQLFDFQTHFFPDR